MLPSDAVDAKHASALASRELRRAGNRFGDGQSGRARLTREARDFRVAENTALLSTCPPLSLLPSAASFADSALTGVSSLERIGLAFASATASFSSW